MSDMMTQEEGMNMSNEQAVQILIPMRNMMCDQNGCPISDAVFALDKAIEALSTDRPRGMWELVPCTDLSEYFEGVKNGFRFRCSNCKDERRRNKLENFCPNCGCRMKGADDGNQ